MNPPDLQTPDLAENAFYVAFEQGDLASMMAVWSAAEDIVCIHPNGPCLTGPDQIHDSWRQILSNSQNIRLRVDAVSCVHKDDLAIHLVHESFLVGHAEKPGLIVVATNIYRRDDASWRMILHHASPSAQAAQSGESRSRGNPGNHQTVH